MSVPMRTHTHNLPGSLSPLSPTGLRVSPLLLGTEFPNQINNLGRLSTGVPTVPTVLTITPTAEAGQNERMGRA